MANKFAFVFLIFIFSFFTSFVFAEEVLTETVTDEESEVEVEESWQYLHWEEVDKDFVLFYEVVVEKFDNKKGEFETIIEKQTEDNDTKIAIRPKLPVGRYRYKVTPHDLLGLPANSSDWFEFSITRAYQPRITSVFNSSSGSSTLYLEEYNDGIFTVDGRNLFMPKSSESKVDSPEEDTATTYILIKKRNGATIAPKILDHDNSNRHLKVLFDPGFLDQGEYNLVATDASGLKSEIDRSSTITVKFKKRFDFDVSLGYAAFLNLYDGTFSDYMKNSFWPIGAFAKMTFIFSKHNFGYFGIGANAHYSYMKSEQTAYDITGNVIDGYLNFVYQVPFYNKKIENKRRHVMTLEFRLGVGLLLFNGFEFEFRNGVKSEKFNSSNLSAQLGFNAQIYITSRLFAEAGFDFVNAFTSEMAFGEVIPTVGIGWQF